MSDSKRTAARPLQLAFWWQLAALLITALVLVHLFWIGYHDAITKAERSIGGIARVNAFALDTTLSTADMLMTEAATALAPRMNDPARRAAVWHDESQHLRLYLARIPQLDSIRVFDAAGKLILSTDAAPRQIDISDRPHFIEARDQPDSGLIISDVVVSRSTNRNAVVLLRAIRDDSGRFVGAISGPLDLSYFERLLTDAQLGPDGSATIRRIDNNRIITRLPYVPGILNRADTTHPAHQRILAGEQSGMVESTGQFDGVPRLLGFQRLEHFPLYVIVGVSRSGVLETWEIRAATAAVLTALALLSMIVFYRRMASTNRLLGSVLDAASEVAIIATDRQGRITLFNHGAERMLGWPADALMGRRLDTLLPDEARPGGIAAHLDQLAGKGSLETAYRRQDGELLPVSLVVTPLQSGRADHTGFLCIASDIAEYKRSTGLQAAQNRILEMIASGEALPRVLDQLVRSLEPLAGDLHCAILLFDATSGSLRIGAASGLPPAYTRTLDGLQIGANRHSGSTAAFLHDATLIDNLATDTGWSPLHDAARMAGIRALWSNPILDASGRLLGLFVVHQLKPGIDTARATKLVVMATHTAAVGIASTAAAAARKAGEQRMRLALHAANMDAYEFVPATDSVHRSGDVTSNWGIGREGPGRDYLERIHPDDQPALLAALDGLRPDAPDYSAEYRLRTPDGHYVWVADWASAVFDEHGAIDRIFGVCCDITERKALDDELRQHQHHLQTLVDERTAQLASSEANLRLILESTADGLYGVDMNGRASFINPAACQMLGLTPEAVIGQPIHALIHHHHADGRDYAASDCPANQTLRHGEAITVTDEVFWHADGHPLPVLYATHPMIRDGAIVGAVVSFTDVTERRALETAREQARQAAERLARVKSEFLANMSHEIRTPLNGILGFARMGYRDSLDSRARKAFGHILDSGQLLLGVVNDILDFSKIEAGKLHLEAVPVDLPALLHATVSTFEERAASRGIGLQAHLAADLPDGCLTDPLRVGQILTNLLSNAVKFTERGEVALHANLDGDQLRFRVTDTGVGIDPAKLPKLFNAFEQADSSTTRRFGGTGLGLAITRRLVDLLGGRIEVRSEVDRGSTFEVHLPYVPAECPPRPEPTAVSAPRPSARLGGLRILAAEDNAVNQVVLEDILLSEGADLTMVDSGHAAVDLVAEGGADAFSVVLMDIQMPGMDGYEATRRIHAIAPALPVIGQTAHAMAEEKAKCLAAGMVAHIAKPIELETLVSTILRHTGEAAPAAAAPRLIDRDALDARYKGRTEFIGRLLAMFASAGHDKHDALAQAIEAADLPRIVEHAHALKGSAGNIMANSLADAARQAEAAARDGKRDAALAAATELNALLARTVAEIEQSAPA